MQASARVRGIVGGGDDGWSVYYRARAMQAAGEPVINLTIGDHDIKTDLSIIGAMTAAMEAGELGYAPVEGFERLRAAVAARVARQSGMPCAAENVVITCGGQAGLFAALNAALDPGDACIVLDPFYATYAQTVRAAAGEPITVETCAADGFQPNPDRIRAALTPKTRAILLNTPNNPTGAVYEPDRLKAIGALARERGLWILSDEVYDTQVWEGRHLSPRALPGLAPHVMVVNSLSKSHAMTGSRLGWVVAPAEVAARLADLSIATNYGLPGFIQAAGVFALEEADAAEAAVRARYGARRAAVLEALGAGGPLRPVHPQGGMYVLLDGRASGLSGVDLANRLLDEAGVATMPGESFGKAAAGHLRLALTQPEEVLRDAVSRISECLGARV